MNKKIHSLALLVNLGIYGVAQAQEPTDTPVSHDDTIVVTAAEQNLQAPGVSTITADEIRKNPVARDVSEIIRTMLRRRAINKANNECARGYCPLWCAKEVSKAGLPC